jgi:ribosome maturation factor RimP
MVNLAKELKEKLSPLVKEENLELVNLEFFSGGPRSILRIYVDKPGGVTIDDCADLSRKISDFLDMEDLIPNKYSLEVSSPGLDRPLVNRDDFIRRKGEKVRVFLKEPIEGKWELVGEIKNLQEETLYLCPQPEEVKHCENIEKAIPLNKVLRAKIIL